MSESKETILVLGVGNTLLSDEAVGVRVIEALGVRDECESLEMRLMDGGTLGLSLLVDMEDADALVVVDAARTGATAGSVHLFVGEDIDEFLRRRGRSPHDIGLDDLMDCLRLRGPVPSRRALVAVEAKQVSVGENLSPDVSRAVPQAVETILSVAREWRRADAGP